MPASLISALKLRALDELKTQGGLSTQVYTEDALLTNIQSVFDELLNMGEVWWPEYMTWSAFTLDGSTGEVTDNLAGVLDRHTDIRMMWYADRDVPIVRLPGTQRYDKVRGTATFWEPLKQDAKVFRILPIDSDAATITVHHTTRPAKFTDDTDEVWMDEDMMAVGAAYYYLSAENAEADATNAMRAHFITRRDAIINDTIDTEVALNRYQRAHTPDIWYTS